MSTVLIAISMSSSTTNILICSVGGGLRPVRLARMATGFHGSRPPAATVGLVPTPLHSTAASAPSIASPVRGSSTGRAGALAELLGGEKRLGRLAQRLRVHAMAGIAHGRAGHKCRAAGSASALQAPSASNMVSVPPFGIASRALTTRFSSASSIWLVSIMTSGSRSGRSNCSSICGPSERSIRSVMPRTRSTRSRGFDLQSCRRANASRRWVSVAPRCAPCIAPSIRRASSDRRHVLAQQLEIAEHRHQQVVEVVRHAAGELADHLHLLRLAQRSSARSRCSISASTRRVRVAPVRRVRSRRAPPASRWLDAGARQLRAVAISARASYWRRGPLARCGRR